MRYGVCVPKGTVVLGNGNRVNAAAGFIVAVCVVLVLLISACYTAVAQSVVYQFSLQIGDSSILNAPIGVAVDGSGNLYVADSVNTRIKKFSAAGTFLASLGSSGSGDGQFFLPEGVAVDGSGSVYVVDTGNNRVQKFSSTGTFVIKWGVMVMEMVSSIRLSVLLLIVRVMCT